MFIELIDAGGVVLTRFGNVADAAEADAHLPHYEGAVAWREVDPIAVAAEIAAREEEDRLQSALLRGTVKVLFNHENRTRALEGKPAVTIDQFKAELKTILGV